MRVGCIICSDSFSSFGDVAAVPCGHTFHAHCLLQWIENSKSCPSCRQKATSKSIIKLFFDSTGGEDTQEDKESLQNQIDNLKFQVVEKTQSLKSIKEENSKYEKQNTGLRDEVIKLENCVKKKETTLAAYKEQMKHLETIVKNASKAEEEARIAKTQLKLFKQIEILLEDNSAEIEDTILSNTNSLNSTECIRSLSTMCTVLKSRMNKLMEEKRRVGDESHALLSRLRETKKEYLKSQDKLAQLQKELCLQSDDVRALERENDSLQKKVSCLQQAIASPSADARNSALHRLISESPAPAKLKRTPEDSLTGGDLTPDVTRKVPRVSVREDSQGSGQPPQGDSDEASPYLRLKSASSLLTFSSSSSAGGAQPRRKDGGLLKPSLRGRRTGFMSPPRPAFAAADDGYDGLGGHHCVTYFPVPKPGQPTKKRGHLTSKVKGATHISSKTIKDFFKDPFADSL